MSVERHHVQEENVGAYLLSALTEIEQRTFEQHLDDCPVCQDEVDRLRPAVHALPRSVDPVDPPARLKTSLMAAVKADAKEAAGGARREGLARRVRERLGGLNDAMAGMRPVVAWVAASIVLLTGVLAGATGLYAVSGGGTDDAPPQVEAVSAKVDKTRVPNASGSLVVPADARNGAVMRVHGLPTLENDSVYQVWLERRGEVISQSTFTVGEDGEGAAAVTDSLESADAVMITRERAPQAKAPTEASILRVAL